MISLDDKWNADTGRILLNGTQAIARSLLAQRAIDARDGIATAGYITGYRGSPLGNVDNTLWLIEKQLGAADVRFQPGVNEDIAATAVAGTQQIDQLPGARVDGVFAAWYGKGPGVDRSVDAIRHGNYAGAHAKGGVILFYGDDHAGKSSTVAYQSEQAMTAALVPVLYPADVGEILHYSLMAFALSRHSGSWVAIKCVNEVVEQTATATIDIPGFRPILPPIADMPSEGLHAAVRPFNPLRAEQIVIDHRLPTIIPFVRANGIDRTIFRSSSPRLAIATAGKSYGDVRQALSLLGLDDDAATAAGVSLYKVGCLWPLDGERLADFAAGHENLLVVEEKKSFIEAQVARDLVNRDGSTRLIGKIDEVGKPLLSATLPLEPAAIARIIADRIGFAAPALPAITAPLDMKRSPFFCSGCPHNRSTRVPEGSLSMTGIGCHTMANFVRPDEAMLPTQMGGEGGNWIGLSSFTDTGHIFQNMGDGTYYHSGLLAIRAAVASGANITYKILYNDAVAMTGGQPVDGPLSVAEIAQQVRHEGVATVVVLSDNPDHHRGNRGFPTNVRIEHRDMLDTVQRSLRETPGCSVLIYEQTCAAEKRRRRKRGTFPDPAKRMVISQEVCEGCGDCSQQSTCVSIVPQPTAMGLKRAIDQSSCNKDFSCNLGFCPSFITVTGAEPRKPAGATIDASLFAALPVPPVASGDRNLMVAGIGGTGVITVGALIGMAAHLEGRAASLFDMTGLAQKNGAVFSHIRIADAPERLHTQRLGRGEADVLLAFDMVAALSAEALATLAPGRTRAIANRQVSATVGFQFDRDLRPEPELLLRRLEKAIGAEAVLATDASGLALALTGDTIAANLMVVGMAAQHGLLPVGIAALEEAIRLNGVAVKLNLTALSLGRLLIADPDAVTRLIAAPPATPLPETLAEVTAHRVAHLTTYQDAALAQRYRTLVDRVAVAETRVAPGSERLALTVAHQLARVLAPKDEYEVARLLTDPALHACLRADFADGAKFSFNMASPMLPGRDPSGRPRKHAFPAWAALPLLKLLRSGRGLRGTPFDPFGYTRERRAERALARDYAALVEATLATLDARTLDDAVTTLSLVGEVRGFGPVKEAAMARYAEALAARVNTAPVREREPA